MIHHLAIVNNCSMRGSSFKQIKLTKLNHQKVQKTAHNGLFCSLQSNPAQQLFTGKESIVLRSVAAVIVLSYFTVKGKKNLRTERKQNYVIKNEKRKKNSDYYYLSNRKVIEVVCSSRISLLAFYSSEEVLSAQVCSLASVSITVL